MTEIVLCGVPVATHCCVGRHGEPHTQLICRLRCVSRVTVCSRAHAAGAMKRGSRWGQSGDEPGAEETGAPGEHAAPSDAKRLAIEAAGA